MSARVRGWGPVPADVVVVGEAPGRIEAETGLAWSGPLRKFAEALESRLPGTVYMTNAVQQPRGRPTKASDALEDLALLREEIEAVRPSAVVALGKVASRALDELGIDHVRMPHPRWVRISKDGWRRWTRRVDAAAKEVRSRLGRGA